VLLLRFAERQSCALLSRLPPRIARFEAAGHTHALPSAGAPIEWHQSSHHHHTFPCMSCSPKPFGSFVPTGFVSFGLLLPQELVLLPDEPAGGRTGAPEGPPASVR